jgi:glyoxylase-like metal-dependent hydrolase (beta-lactamase superfamily II)
LIEAQDCLVLVDTGIGLQDVALPSARLGRGFRRLVRPRLDAAECARAQIERAGFRPEDVRHIILTHLDPDHAGGLADFPRASVHVHRPELDAARNPKTLNERRRYRSAQWRHGPRWQPHEVAGESWSGFACVRALPGLSPEILLLPLSGHTRGHAGVAVQTASGWLVHAGDAFFSAQEMATTPSCPTVLALFQRALAVDDAMRLHNQARLRQLAAAGDAQVICSHAQFSWHLAETALH